MKTCFDLDLIFQGPEECHDKTVDTLVDVPEESCDLNPQKTCRLVTRLVPSLRPKQECTSVPKEVCVLKFTQPELRAKPLRTEWCLDEAAAGAASEPQATYGVEPQASYDAGAVRRGRVITNGSSNRNSLNNRVNSIISNRVGGNSVRPQSSSSRLVGSSSNSPSTINSNRVVSKGKGARGGNGSRSSKNNRGAGNNRGNNKRVSSSRLVNNNNNNNNRGFGGVPPTTIVANGNRIVGIGNQVVNGNVRPLSLSNGISNGIDNGISNNRAVPVGSAPFIRSAQVKPSALPL